MWCLEFSQSSFYQEEKSKELERSWPRALTSVSFWISHPQTHFSKFLITWENKPVYTNHFYLIILLLVAKRILNDILPQTSCIPTMQAYSSYLFPLFKEAGSSIKHQICPEIPKKKNGSAGPMKGLPYARTHSPTQVRLWLPNPKVSVFKSFISPYEKIQMRPFCSTNINIEAKIRGQQWLHTVLSTRSI